jgi:hypothetical protein
MALATATATARQADPASFAARVGRMSRLLLEDRGGRLVEFRANGFQNRLFGMAEEQMRRVGYVRTLVLKYRRGGCSTGISALFYDDTETFPHRIAMVAAHDAKATEVLWKRIRAFRDYTPEEQQRPIEFNSKKEIQYAVPHGSLFMVSMAGEGMGRASNVLDLHISEAAWLRNGRTTFNGVISCVPQSMPDMLGTMVFLETTAKGEDDLFWPMFTDAMEAWERGEEDWSGWMPLFFSWLEDPANASEVPNGYEWGAFSSTERELQALGATAEQLYWRRARLKDFNGDEEIFKQEFPSTWREAFLHSGRAFWPAESMERVRVMVEPGRPYLLAWDAGTPLGLIPRPVEDAYGAKAWSVWKEPNPEHDYIVYADVARGRLSDKTNERSDPDYHYAWVLDRVTLEQVARMHNRMDAGLLGEQLLMAGIWYNMAWTGCEVPGVGLVPLERMRTFQIAHRPVNEFGVGHEKRYLYPHLFYRGGLPDRIEEREIGKLGLELNDNTRQLVMQRLKECLTPVRPGEWQGRLIIHDETFYRTMGTFIVNKDGKPEARSGFHDDPQLGVGGGMYLHDKCPRQTFGPPPEPFIPFRQKYLQVGQPHPQVVELMKGRA